LTIAEGAPATSVADVRLSTFERLPWRRIILVLLAIVIVAVTTIGIYKTLTSPEAANYSGEFWAQLTVDGLSYGAILSMVALGYSMVYGILRMINFAHGEVFMAGGFASFFFANAYAKSGFLNSNTVVAVLIVMTVSVLVSVGVALLLERVCYRPLRNAPRLVPLITAIGASLFIQNSFRGFFGPQSYGYPRPSSLNGQVPILGVHVNKIDIAVLVVAVVCMLVLQMFVSRTKTGRSMRAVAEDREIASLMGIDVDRTIAITFAVGGVLAGIAGVLFGMTFQQIQFTSGFTLGIAAFTAAVLGGIGSIGGATLGGFLIGVLRAVGPVLILTGFGIPSVHSLNEAFVFLVLVLVLVFRPGGLLGTGEAEKV